MSHNTKFRKFYGAVGITMIFVKVLWDPKITLKITEILKPNKESRLFGLVCISCNNRLLNTLIN